MILPDQIPTDQLIGHLYELGHFHVVDSDGFRGVGPDDVDDVLSETRTSTTVENAVKSYQHWRGLAEDGDFGAKTLGAHLHENRRCGMPDIMERGRGGQSADKWPEACQLNITWAFDFAGLRWADSQGRTWDDAWDWSVAFWNDICGCRLAKSTNAAGAHISSKAGRMSGGTLAWSELAYGDCGAQLDQEYNKSVDWRWFIGSTTIGHEVGHALGWGHAPQKGNIMYFAHDEGYDGEPGPWDIDQAVRRYGEPVAPEPEPTPEPPVPAPPSNTTIVNGRFRINHNGAMIPCVVIVDGKGA